VEASKCPRCGKDLVEVGDDKRFLECVCGYKFDAFLSREAAPAEPEPISWREVDVALSSTIKRDSPTKLIVFAAMMLTQTEDDQINVGLQAESATGKTYIPLEVAAYFPPEEVVIIAGASPTAFFHEYGSWDEERKVNVVNLERKILIFLDFPDYRLVEKLRPLLSHDRKVLTFKITDKSEKHGLRTKTVELVGFPTVVFCSTKLNPDDQEKTRLLLVSPSVDMVKLSESLKLIAWKQSDRVEFEARIEADPKRAWLRGLVRKVRDSGVTRVKIEGDIYEEFVKHEPSHKPRHQRDLPRVASLIKAHALLNCNQREEDEDGTLIAISEDVEAGFELYGRVSLANELGVSPYVMRIYEDVILPQLSELGTTRKQVYQAHYSRFGRTANQQWYEKEIFPALTTAGLLIEELDPNDKRRKLLYPPDQTMVNSGFVDFWNRVQRQNNNSAVRGVQGNL
jgi:hypothetical protein